MTKSQLAKKAGVSRWTLRRWLRDPYIQQQLAPYQWENEVVERMVTKYLEGIQASHEEIRIEVCQPKPDLPGYPEVDYHPDDYPIVLMDEKEPEWDSGLMDEKGIIPHISLFFKKRFFVFFWSKV